MFDQLTVGKIRILFRFLWLVLGFSMIYSGHALASGCSSPVSAATTNNCTNSATITDYSVTSSGSISVSSGIGFENQSPGVITNFQNQGTIYGIDDGVSNANGARINSFVNSGTITGQTEGIYNNGIINTLTNAATGVIAGNGDFSLFNDGSGLITSLINWGTISSSQYSNGPIQNNGEITSLTNMGNIVGIILNNGVIGTINNLQGGSNPLSLNGNLPSTYNIIINNPANYGKLIAYDVSGSMSFGIYGGGITGVPASIVNRGIYSSVLMGTEASFGITPSNLNGQTGNYNGFAWRLVEVDETNFIWDLIVTGASTADTQASLQLSANALQSTYALQAATLNNGLTYDCNVFDTNGFCVTTGGRYDRINTGGAHTSNGLLIGAYKLNANIRLGTWLDQNLAVASDAGVSLNNGNPMLGIFGVWNADPSGNGLEVKVSAAYGDKVMKVTREIIGSSEAGTGSTRLNTQGASATVSLNLPINAMWTTSPYLGVRYIKVGAAGYTEESSSAVTAPLTYSELNQESTTALAGVKFTGRMSPAFGIFASAGLEQELNNSGGDYTATGVAGLTTITLNPNIQKTRPVAGLGAYYDIDKTQRISIHAAYRQEPFQTMNSVSTMLMYTVGF